VQKGNEFGKDYKYKIFLIKCIPNTGALELKQKNTPDASMQGNFEAESLATTGASPINPNFPKMLNLGTKRTKPHIQNVSFTKSKTKKKQAILTEPPVLLVGLGFHHPRSCKVVITPRLLQQKAKPHQAPRHESMTASALPLLLKTARIHVCNPTREDVLLQFRFQRFSYNQKNNGIRILKQESIHLVS